MTQDQQPLDDGQLSRGSALAGKVFTVLIVINLIITFGLTFNLDSFLYNMALTARYKPPGMISETTQFDQTIRQFSPAGNLFLRFEGFDLQNATHQQLASFYYYRSVYALYPRKVIVSDKNVVINKGRDLIALNYNPDIEEATALGFENLLTIQCFPDDHVEFIHTPSKRNQ